MLEDKIFSEKKDKPRECTECLPFFVQKMKEEGLPPIIIDTFSYYYLMVGAKETGMISDDIINPVDPEELVDARSLDEYTKAGEKALTQTVMIKLNGGLGTSMGLTRAKSLMHAKNNKSFLEIIFNQASVNNIQLALMNSFSTHDDTVNEISKLKTGIKPYLFLQHKFPKILQHSLMPAKCPNNPNLEWNPPGHGDIYTALYASGTLRSFLDQGIKYAFISNSDNLGATLDTAILGYFAHQRYPFMMEVARRTPSDQKGGHLAKFKNGRLLLRESAQCPEENMSTFSDISIFKFFNTNNIWLDLNFLDNMIREEGVVHLPMIVNPKKLDPRNDNSPNIFQIETAMGSALSLFEGTAAIKVPRSRFFPVKKCNELLAIRSDIYMLDEQYRIVQNPAYAFEHAHIHLDPTYYDKIDMFNQRFQYGPPSLIECESLSIHGDFNFKANVKIKGKVTLTNTGDKPATIEEGTVIDQDMVF